MAYQIDPRSETWLALEGIATKRLDDLRKKNDGRLSEAETSYLRGQIAEVKNLLTLANPAPAHNADEY